MNGLYTAVATIGGGLGVFLLGMRHLSDGLQAASGERLRRFMSLATGHRAAGVATGVASTLVVQSSSIIIVMLVGFVTSGLMTLSQAVNVLIGANIGTTFTIWLMAFAPSPELLGLGLFIFGALAYFPLRTGRMRHVGLAVMGLGLVFLGMALMKNGVAPIKESPELSAQLRSLEATGLGSAALVALASALFTAVIQSSAASIMIFMTFASEGLVSVDTAIVALFGANIGTTATGWLAAIGQSRAAKRTALAHTASNVIGSVLLLPLALPVLAPLAKAAFPNCAATVPIAVADTTFALVRGLLLFPFVMPFSALLEKVLPDRADEKPHRSMLNANLAVSPDIALEQAAKEVDFMAESIIPKRSRANEQNYPPHADDVLEQQRQTRIKTLGNYILLHQPYYPNITDEEVKKDERKKFEKEVKKHSNEKWADKQQALVASSQNVICSNCCIIFFSSY